MAEKLTEKIWKTLKQTSFLLHGCINISVNQTNIATGWSWYASLWVLYYFVKIAVRLGPKITEIVKGKLSLGAKIIRTGGVDKSFKHHFSSREGEKLLKAPQCYLSTTAGPIAGLLFISTDKVAFCSDRSMKLSSPTGEFVRIRYKVLIPVGKILRANESQNVKRPSKKYIEIVTVDNFDFWFMGFLNYHKTLKYLQQALSQAQYFQLDQKWLNRCIPPPGPPTSLDVYELGEQTCINIVTTLLLGLFFNGKKFYHQ